MKLGRREKILAVVFGAFLFLFVMERFITRPFSERLTTITARIDASEKKLRRLLYMDSQKDNITGFFDRVKSDIELGKTEEEIFSVIIKTVEEIAKDTDVALVKMKPEATEEKKGAKYRTKRVSVTVEGYQNNIVEFLYKLENGQYPLKANKLDFKIKDRDSGVMSADMDVHCIYFR